MDINEIRGQAEHYQRRGQWPAALSLYEKISAAEPNDWQNCIAMADTYLNMGRWDDAARLYRQSLETDSAFDWAWHNLGVALYNIGDLTGVERCQRILQSVNPAFWEINQAVPIVRKYHTILSAVEVDANTSPLSPEVAIKLEQDHIKEKTQAAEAETTDAHAQDDKQFDQEQFEQLYLEGKSLAQQGQHEGAVEKYLQAIALNEEHLEIHHFIGDSLLNLDRVDEAIAAYKTSLRYNPSDNWTYFNLGISLTKNGDHKQSERYFRDLLELDPNFTQARLLLAEALEAQEKWTEAAEIYSDYLEHIDPENSAIVEKLNHLLPKCAKYTISKLTEHLQRAYESQSESSAKDSQLAAAKAHLEKLNSIALDTFLTTNSTMLFPAVESPKVTVVLILYNRAELTFSCLNSILRSNFKSLELVIVDNKSTDRTRQLLARVKGARIVLNEENKHFLLACNQAKEIATGEHLLFLNNDAQVLGNSLENAVRTLESDPEIGAVGGKVILPDGSLQEAGSIIWQDGSCLGYGRRSNPNSPEYMFKREVDYCSGAFLLTPRDLFSKLGGFDEALQPAYYEETDYCVRLSKAGRKLIYDPNVVILHYEFGSSNSSERSGQAIELQKRNKQIFLEKHADWLSKQQPPALENILAARAAPDNRKKILFIEDRIPHKYYGSGYTRGNTILHSLLQQHCFVTIYPTDLSYVEDWSTAYSDIPRSVELMSGYGRPLLKDFLLQRQDYYDLVLVSRPHNMEFVSEIIEETGVLKETKIVYDAEAIFCERTFLQMKLKGNTPSDSFVKAELEKEMSLCRHADHILSVSQKEADRFRALGYAKVSVLGHVLDIIPTSNAFSERRNILFVGAIYDIDSPNADSVLWFSQEIFPKIQTALGADVNLLIVGTNTVPELNERIAQLSNTAIKMLGRVDDLTELYNSSRIFVVPTRYAAGIPHKAHEAAARGIPMVTTSLIAQQLNWIPGEHLLSADSPTDFAQQCNTLYSNAELWNTIRSASIQQIKHDCSSDKFDQSIRSALS